MASVWKIRGGSLPLEKTVFMGILNLTPDSFSDGGKFLDPEKALSQAKRLVQEGAAILDLGAESTRPGAESVSAQEELERILPCLEKILSKLPALVSIDTTKPEVAETCLKLGAHIINDVSGLKDSGEEMLRVVQRYGAGLVLMHRRGNPATMQSLTDYADVTEEVIRELSASLTLAKALDPRQVVLDPGLGFAKTAEQNLELLRNLGKFHRLGYPLLLGPSRKSFLGKITGREADQRELATSAVCVQAVLHGVQILRVHEVGAMRDAVLVAEAIRGEKHVRT